MTVTAPGAEVARSSEFAGTDLVLTAGIYYTDRGNVRFETSLEFTERARDAGVPTVFVDASPEATQGTWVADAHRERGAVVLRAEVPGIATQRQQGVAYAVDNGAEKVVGTESEKPLVPTFAAQLSEALDTTDILVVGRTPEALASMPPVQKRTEHLAGWILQRAHHLPPDALAGPRGFSVAGAAVLAEYPSAQKGMNNWIYLYDTPLVARQRGLQVGHVALNFTYPAGMVAEETGSPVFDGKRYDQFELQLTYLLDQAKLPEGVTIEKDSAGMVSYVRYMLEHFEGASLQKKADIIDHIRYTLSTRYGYELPRP
ncbi:MAG TPA: hypothetical protein VF466_05780 [Candidatus Saccharimonadales bacterium]